MDTTMLYYRCTFVHLTCMPSKKVIHAGNQQGSRRISDPSETTRRIPHKKALAILLALLFTDGCVSPKGKSWRLYFVNKSESLIELFQDCVLQVFTEYKPNVRLGLTADGLRRAIVDSKAIGTYLVEAFGTFRTLRYENGKLPQAKLPLQFLREHNLGRSFLQVAFSCDGGLCFYPAKRSGSRGGTKWLIRTVFLSCAHPVLREGYKALLTDFGIRSREVAADYKIKIETERDIRLFSQIIGFVPGTLVTRNSKYWIGYEKNEVLKLMIASYCQPSKFYQLPIFTR